ncbi:MAG: hypothetical protein H6537_04720 [Bacteroidales bacterium]|nr:hypothetical protein [Bacteroidales bacterium]
MQGNALAYEELFPITQRGVCWAKTSSPTITDSISTDSIGNGTFASNMANLNAGIKYYVRAYAKNSEGVGYGLEKAFTTLDGIPELATDSVNNVTATSATVYGMVSDNDGLDILEKGFCWGRGAILTTDSSHQAVSGNQLGNFALTIGNLSLGTNYCHCLQPKELTAREPITLNVLVNFTTKTGCPR